MNDLGLSFLKGLQEHRTPEGEAFFQNVTVGGEGLWLWAVLGVVFWIWGSRPAYRAGLALVAGDLLACTVKYVFCIPRPWVKDPGILPVASAQAAAFGYSFPSGHAASTAALWGGMAAAAGRAWLWGPLLAWVGLVAFSRLYLGVHTPVDVAGSLVLAIPVVWGMGRVQEWAERNPGRGWIVVAGAVLAALAAEAFLHVRPVPEDAWPTYGRDVTRAAWALVAFVAAWRIERNWIRFEPAKLGGYRVLAVGVGVLVLALMAGNLRRLVAPWLGENGSLYAATAANPLWVFVVWPWLLRGLEKPAPR